MQLRVNHLHAADFQLGVDIDGYASAVVRNRGAVVRVQNYAEPVREAVCRLVNRVVHNFPQNVMQSLDARRAYVHTGTHTHRVETFKHLYVAGGILSVCHVFFLRNLKMNKVRKILSSKYSTIDCGWQVFFDKYTFFL